MASNRTNGTSRSLEVNSSSKTVGRKASPQRNARPKRVPSLNGNNVTYTVGYGRPPKHTQFRPGQSGNPSGGRKKRESLQDIVAQVLFDKMPVQIGERTEKIPGVTALVRTAMTRALQGDCKFLMAVITLIRISGLSDVGGDALLPETDSRGDEAILADFLKRQGFSPKPSITPNSKSTKVNSDEVDNDN
jgi:hypothetical protein